jgi:hypothetical protein
VLRTSTITGQVTLARQQVLVLLTFIALLQPVVSALSPGLAGWSPAHGHAYIGGMPVAHHHPYEATRRAHLTSDGSVDTFGAPVGFTQDDGIGTAVVPVPTPRQLFATTSATGSQLWLVVADPSVPAVTPDAPPPRG